MCRNFSGKKDVQVTFNDSYIFSMYTHYIDIFRVKHQYLFRDFFWEVFIKKEKMMYNWLIYTLCEPIWCFQSSSVLVFTNEVTLL